MQRTNRSTSCNPRVSQTAPTFDSSPFHLSADGTGYPTFAFRITSTQLNNLAPGTDFSNYTATLDGSYSVTGTYATYTVTQHSTYDSSSNAGTGTIGSSGSLPKC